MVCGCGTTYRSLTAILAAGLVQVAAANTRAPEPQAAAPRAAEVVITDARIVTEEPGHPAAEALAIQGDHIIWVGAAATARAWIGPNTVVHRLGGRLVLPGLVDAHIHASMIADIPGCDLESRAVSLRALASFGQSCLQRMHLPAGSWLVIKQWDYAKGNQPDSDHRTLREALDQVSTRNPVELYGNDGHHSAYNSVALANAKDSTGATIGLSKATLAAQFTSLEPFVGVDARGEPSGAVNEEARRVLHAPDWLLGDLPMVMRMPERVTQRLNSVGITAILDAYVPPDLLPFYDSLAASGHLSVRATLAQYYDPELFKSGDGRVDYDRMLTQARAIRAKYAADPLIRADVVKLFADGGLEGNPYSVPPTMPNAALLRPFLQPIFGKDSRGRLTVTGYVDGASADCKAVRQDPARYGTESAITEFIATHGYHPRQCEIHRGTLYHDSDVIYEFVRRFHTAGFSLHIHAISDQGVRTSIDAIEAARASDGNAATRDTLAHVQLANPTDIARMGRDRLFVAFTYSWAYADPQYDMTVIPFIDRVSGNSYLALHRSGGYYDANAYPFRAAEAAGAILIAGSDAPVDTPDPRPFINIAHAITRRYPPQPALNPAQSISIRSVLAAYTINGARALGREREFGSLEAGKSADFVVLDRDILALADSGRAADIANTKVVETWFRGRQVFARKE